MGRGVMQTRGPGPNGWHVISRAVFPKGTIRRLIWEANSSTDDNYGESEALRWAGGFQFPADVASRVSNEVDL